MGSIPTTPAKAKLLLTMPPISDILKFFSGFVSLVLGVFNTNRVYIKLIDSDNINIIKGSKIYPNYSHSGYDFAYLDFQIQNTSDTQLNISNLEINIGKADLNYRPILDLSYSGYNCLYSQSPNNVWHDLEFQFLNSSIYELNELKVEIISRKNKKLHILLANNVKTINKIKSGEKINVKLLTKNDIYTDIIFNLYENFRGVKIVSLLLKISYKVDNKIGVIKLTLPFENEKTRKDLGLYLERDIGFVNYTIQRGAGGPFSNSGTLDMDKIKYINSKQTHSFSLKETVPAKSTKNIAFYLAMPKPVIMENVDFKFTGVKHNRLKFNIETNFRHYCYEQIFNRLDPKITKGVLK